MKEFFLYKKESNIYTCICIDIIKLALACINPRSIIDECAHSLGRQKKMLKMK